MTPALVLVVPVVVLEQRAELVRSVPVHAFSNVRVDQFRGYRRAVAEDVLDHSAMAARPGSEVQVDTEGNRG